MHPLAPIKKLKRIELLVLDFDGVLTDGRVCVDNYGNESVFCHHRDGTGIKLLREVGVKVIVLSGQISKYVKARCDKMHIECFQKIHNKRNWLKRYLEKNHISVAKTVYVGDDVNDLECLRFIALAGFAAAPKDCAPKLQPVVDYITAKKGGKGAVREICDLILAAKEEVKNA